MEKNYKRIIGNIVNLWQDKLSFWELEFISSVFEWHIMNEKPLSKKQKEIIIKINRRIMSGE